VAGCGYNEIPLSAPVSGPPAPPGGDAPLQAGFGRADITPPPGPGLYAYGPEGREARGFRVRLYAKALVLEDAEGERIAFVVADLGVISLALHRSAAQRTFETAGIGADRLVLAATHTHAGPGNFMGVKQFDDHGTSVAGFDTAMVSFLSERIGDAVRRAVDSLRPAQVGFAMVPVWGFTRNRSLGAFRNNPDSLKVYEPPARLDLDESQRAVDPTWTMLRVDLFDAVTARFVPAGALSIFAIHGNAIPAVNDLYDADIHAAMQRRLETHVDSLNDETPSFAPRAVHLVANGAEGDVAPTFPEAGRCPAPKLRLGRRPGGPHTPPPAEEWRPVPANLAAACMDVSTAYVDSAGPALAERAVAIFDSLAGRLSADVRIARAFRTVPLRGAGAPPDLCDAPRVGTVTLVGSDDSTTRYYRWRLFGLIPMGFEHGGSSVETNPRGCHAQKRIALGPLQGLLVGEHGLPEVAQLMLVQVGGLALAVAPAEVSVTAGVIIKKTVLREGVAAGVPIDLVAVMSLANGDLRYIVTPYEYAMQDYEGASTLYGPQSAIVLARKFGELAGLLGPGGQTGAAADVGEVIAYAGKLREVLPSREAGPAPERIERRLVSQECAGDTAVARWIDTYPGRLVPADGPVLRIERETSRGWEPYIWDDHSRLEVRALEPQGTRGYLWEARWLPGESLLGTYRIVLEPRDGFGTLRGDAFEACVAAPAGASGDLRR
jgi:neutral ceramidase